MRVKLDAQNQVRVRHDYEPYGVEIARSGDGYGGADSVPLRFTGKERDAETALDYFGARYFSGSMGRFTSPDPLGLNALRILSPQRWNMYAYAVNNPLLYIDPDGRDAIVINFKTLAFGAGHMATVSVHRDGSATFMDYGPRGGSKPVWGGEYRVVPLSTQLKFGSDNLPLVGPLSVLAGEIADLAHVDPCTVSFAYFKTSDTETSALDEYFARLRKFSQGNFNWTSLYVVGAHDCAEVCNIAMSKAGVGRGSEVGDVPNVLFNWLYIAQAHASYSGATGKLEKKSREQKPDVRSTFHPCTSADPDCPGN